MLLFQQNVPASGGSFTEAVSYAFTGGNLLLTSDSIIDLAIIAVGAVNLVLVIHKSAVYKVLSVLSFIFVLTALVNGARFVASNFNINGISYGMAARSWPLLLSTFHSDAHIPRHSSTNQTLVNPCIRKPLKSSQSLYPNTTKSIEAEAVPLDYAIETTDLTKCFGSPNRR